MAYGSILVPIDEHPAAAGSLEAAIRLAGALGAHLEGLAIIPPLAVPLRLRPRQSAATLMKKEYARDKAEARVGVRRFEAQARKAGVASVEGVAIEAEAAAILAIRARTADLVVLPQPGEDDIGILGGHAVEASILSVGRPVLLVPEKGLPAGFPRKILVAWNGSRESARALSDAVPLLARAKSVVVFTAGPAGDEGPIHGAKAAVRYLARHGIAAETLHATSTDDRVGDAILARAKKIGASLVVMGAYGRPRFAELVLGGATRAILRKASVAVLMSH
jgi:nucleotide-binding universal stress UspA family protein